MISGQQGGIWFVSSIEHIKNDVSYSGYKHGINGEIESGKDDESMKRKTYNNVVRATKMIQKKGYSFEEANDMAIRLFDKNTKEMNSIEFYIDKIQEKIITVAERIEIGKRNHQIICICLKDFTSREIIGFYESENEIPKEILLKPSGDDWDRGFGHLTITVK